MVVNSFDDWPPNVSRHIGSKLETSFLRLHGAEQAFDCMQAPVALD
jgi:hypothetical protein